MRITVYIRLLIAFAFLAASSPSIFAFTTTRLYGFSNHPNHERITTDALLYYSPLGIMRKNGQEVTFTVPVLNFIVNYNVQTDLDNANIPSMHFDQDQFISAQRRLVRQRKAIVRSALSAGGADAAQKTLGVALHTIQDFYSHSTWVEQGHTLNDLAPLGVEDLTNISTGYTRAIPGFVSNPSLGATCDSYGLLFPIKLTSDYFVETQLGKAYGDWSTNGYINSSILGFPPDRCIHGAPTFAGPGVNKDSDVRGKNFDRAKAFAIAASRKFVDQIVTDLGKNTDAICRLFGREGDCVPSDCTEYVSELPFAPGSYSFGVERECNYGGPQSVNTPRFHERIAGSDYPGNRYLSINLSSIDRLSNTAKYSTYIYEEGKPTQILKFVGTYKDVYANDGRGPNLIKEQTASYYKYYFSLQDPSPTTEQFISTNESEVKLQCIYIGSPSPFKALFRSPPYVAGEPTYLQYVSNTENGPFSGCGDIPIIDELSDLTIEKSFYYPQIKNLLNLPDAK